MHRAKKCPKPIRLGLERMGLMDCRPKRWRFFYEVPEEKYKMIKEWLNMQDITFSDYMEERSGPWEERLWEI